MQSWINKEGTGGYLLPFEVGELIGDTLRNDGYWLEHERAELTTAGHWQTTPPDNEGWYFIRDVSEDDGIEFIWWHEAGTPGDPDTFWWSEPIDFPEFRGEVSE